MQEQAEPVVPSIFISYRRDDEPFCAGRLHDRLAAKFGNDRVFIDVDDMLIGFDFREMIREQLDGVDVVLAVVGPRWNAPRLADPQDLVRTELQEGLLEGKILIPVLVGDTAMPLVRDLPPELEKFVFRNAIRVRFADFDSDVIQLIDGTEKSVRRRESLRRALPQQSAAGYVFLSYAPVDFDYVKKLGDALKDNGIKYWSDQDIPPGVNWQPTTQERLESSAAIVVIMSDAAFQSASVRQEISAALTMGVEMGHTILPISLGGAIPIMLRAYQCVNAWNGELPPAEWFEQVRFLTTQT